MNTKEEEISMSTTTGATRVSSVDVACARARETAPWFAATDLSTRAGLLEAIADAVDAHIDELVPIAMAESRLGEERLRGEVGRTTGQLRLMANVVRDGAFLGVVIDHADPSLTPPRPDLRRMNIPLGPVAVFAASNFPFAFSTLGGDTASALASGCPVVVKSNPGHPQLSDAIMAVAQDALVAAGAPDGVLGLVDESLQAGIDLVNDDRIEAVAFTGSQRGGLALAKIAADRPRPIPFFGELGSINPMFVTADYLAGREAEVATGFVGSFTLGAGQFCTKPGLLIAPRDEALRDVEVLHAGGLDDANDAVRPTLMAVSANAILAHPELLEECFGPMSLLVEYDDAEQMLRIADALPGLLAAGVHAAGDESVLAELLPRLTAHAGRVLWGGWPTGVAVTWSMQHGGPFPATTRPESTSVGAAAVQRFIRPVTYQSVPEEWLSPALHDANPWAIPQRVDGVLS